MVQFFGHLKGAPSLSDILAPSLGQGLGQMFATYSANNALESALSDPSLKNAPIEEKLLKIESKMRPYGSIGEQLFNRRAELEQKAYQTQQNRNQKLEEQENYNIVKEYLGKEVSDLWKVSDQGARTEIMKEALKAKGRNKNLSELFQNQEEKLPQQKDDYAYDFSGLLPNEVQAKKNILRKENISILQDAEKKLKSLNNQKSRVTFMENLSNKLPDGFFQKMTRGIDPFTGKIIVSDLATPEAELFVKIVNDFTDAAKDSYGARVTNFDLEQFLKRLPTLANTTEGRKLIFDYMKNIHKMDEKYDKNLIKTFQDYSLEGISQENVLRKVEKMMETQDAQKEDTSKEIRVKAPDGQIGFIKEDQLAAAQKKGFKVIE